MSPASLLFFPDRFFLQFNREKVNLIPPAIIVGFPGVFTIITFFGLPTASPPGYFLIMGPLMVVSEIVSLLIMWGVATAVLFGLSMIFSGKGSFELTMQNTGYGILPYRFLK